MANPVVANIIKSKGVLWVAPTGESKPDETTVDYGDAWGGNWVRVGYTKAPLTVAYNSDEFDIEVEEELAPVKRTRVKETGVWETVLAELTADYLQYAASNQDTVSETAAGASQDAYEETGLGGEPILTEKQWGMEGLHITSGGEEQPVRVFIHKGTAKLNAALEFSQRSGDYTGLAIQINALTDTTQSEGQKLFLFQRVTGEKTS